MRTLSLLVLTALALAAAPAAHAQGMDAAVSAKLLLRILAYDQNIADRGSEVLPVAVVFREADESSRFEHDALREALDELSRTHRVSGREVRVLSVPWTTSDALSTTLAADQVGAVWLCAGLGSEVGAIATITQDQDVLTFAGVETYLDDGVAIGLLDRRGSPRIVVDLPASRQEGAKLDASLLGLAEVRR